MPGCAKLAVPQVLVSTALGLGQVWSLHSGGTVVRLSSETVDV